VDNATEAAVIAGAAGYSWGSGSIYRGAIREEENRFLIMAYGEGDTCPVTSERYLLEVTRKGELRILRQHISYYDAYECYFI
jgi:hypothetical protein